MTLYARRQARQAVPLNFRPQKTTAHRPETIGEKILVGGLVVFLLLFLVTPLLALLAQSLLDRQGNLTLAYYQALPELRRGSFLFISPLTAMRNSLFFALFTVLVAGSLGLISAQMLSRPGRLTRWLEPVFMLPLGASAVTLGFGYVVTFSGRQGSPYLILAAHALVAFPFVVRSLLPVIQAIRPNLREAAAVLGAAPGRVWREIDLPIIGRALLVAAMFAFTVSMGEFGASSFVARANSEFATMPVAIARYLGQPGALNFGQAMAMSTVLMVVTAAGFVAIERFRYGDIGEF
jgi:thiamine transport system permease protein